MKRIPPLVTLLLVSLLLAAPARAQTPTDTPNPPSQPPQPEAPANPTQPLQPEGAEPTVESDLYVGDRAPDFKLDGLKGETVRLADLEGHWAVLVFDPSRSSIGALKSIDPAVRKLGARLYGVTRDGWEALKSFSARAQLPFVLLSDLTGQISQLYGMYDEDTDRIMPGIVLLDPKGVVRMIIVGQSLHPNEVLQLVRHTIVGA